MSLRHILADIASDIGLSLDNPAEKSWLILKVDEQAKELWETRDLPDSLREQVFVNDDSTANIVALPSYVGDIRGIRPCYGNIRVEDLRPHYQSAGWDKCTGWSFRDKYRCGVNRSLLSATKLKFTLNGVESSDCKIRVQGRTDLAERSGETVVIPAGELEGETLFNYIDEETITIEKYSPTIHDIEITDINGNSLGIIFNYALVNNYRWIQFSCCGSSGTGTEFLFKPRYVPMRDDFDQFMIPEDYDKAIFWLFISVYLAKQEGQEIRAAAAASNADTIIKNRIANQEMGKQRKLDFGESPYYRAQNYSHYTS